MGVNRSLTYFLLETGDENEFLYGDLKGDEGCESKTMAHTIKIN